MSGTSTVDNNCLITCIRFSYNWPFYHSEEHGAFMGNLRTSNAIKTMILLDAYQQFPICGKNLHSIKIPPWVKTLPPWVMEVEVSQLVDCKLDWQCRNAIGRTKKAYLAAVKNKNLYSRTLSWRIASWSTAYFTESLVLFGLPVSNAQGLICVWLLSRHAKPQLVTYVQSDGAWP